jgi:hypothetical protein
MVDHTYINARRGCFQVARVRRVAGCRDHVGVSVQRRGVRRGGD